MKDILAMAALCILFISCSKNGTSATDAPKNHADSLSIITNNWTLVQDSLRTQNYTLPNNKDSINTIGKDGDTWHFETNSLLEINETDVIQVNVSYQFTNDSKLGIQFSFSLPPATISLLNSNNVIFYWNDTNSSGGFYYRKVILKRG